FKRGLAEAFHATKDAQRMTQYGKPAALHLLPHEKTAISLETFSKLRERLTAVPENLHLHPKLERHLHELKTAKMLNWGAGALTASASLLTEGFPVRLAGQDTQRGTFSHRHAVWVDQESEERYFPLQHLMKPQAHCTVVNSPLSEFASMGFEYG